jgi:hypothetical protein
VIVAKQTETWMIMPSGTGAYNVYLVDAGKGCCAAGTMKRATMGSADTPDQAKNVVIFQGATDIYMFDGKSVTSISDDIEDIFDSANSYCINSTMIAQSEGFFDEKNHYHWCYASGSSTSLNKEIVLDTEKMRWYPIERGTNNYLQCGATCVTTTGNKHSYGCTLTGFAERLNYGTTFDGTAITHFITTSAMILGKKLDYETLVRDIRLICGATNTTTNVITISYYGNESSTAVSKTLELKPQKSGKTIAIPGQQTGEEYFTFHKFKFTMITSDETTGFEPINLDILYLDKRQFLGDQ